MRFASGTFYWQAQEDLSQQTLCLDGFFQKRLANDVAGTWDHQWSFPVEHPNTTFPAAMFFAFFFLAKPATFGAVASNMKGEASNQDVIRYFGP